MTRTHHTRGPPPVPVAEADGRDMGAGREGGVRVRRGRPATWSPSSSPRPRDRRDRRRLPPLVRGLLLAAGLAAVGLGGYLAWRHVDGSRLARSEIAAAIEDVSAADEVIVPLDEAVSAEVGESSTEMLDRLVSDSDAAVASLDSAEDHLSSVASLDEFMTDDDRDVVSALRDSIGARRQMLGDGKVLLDMDSSVAQARDALTQAMEKAVSAGTEVRESVSAANGYAAFLAGQEGGESDPGVPVTLDGAAASDLASALSLVAAARSAFPEADYSAYESYLQKRSEAVGLLLEADTAIASGDYERAAGLIDQYNAADAAAALLGASVPSDPSDVLVGPYTSGTSTQRAAYERALDQASAADGRVRDYQGLSASSTVSA